MKGSSVQIRFPACVKKVEGFGFQPFLFSSNIFKRLFINEKTYRLQIFFHSCHLYVFISCQMIVFLLCKIIQNQFCRTTDSCIVTKCCKGKSYIFICKERILLKWLFYIFKKNLPGFLYPAADHKNGRIDHCCQICKSTSKIISERLCNLFCH